MNRSKQTRRRQRQRQTSGRRHTPRRGVLLLVVLSMLVLFLLIGTTFLITSGQYRTQMKVADEAVRATFQPADLLERALMQLVRDTNNANSVIRHHSLLRDLYGVDGFVGRITMNGQIVVGTGLDRVTRQDNLGLIRYDGIEERIAPRYAGVEVTAAIDAITNPPLGPTRGQLVEFYVADVETTFEGEATRLSDHNAVGLEFDRNGIPVEHRMSQVDGYYDGSLLTMLDGPCRGQTVRVVSYDHLVTRVKQEGTNQDNTGPTTITISRWRVMAPKRANGDSLELGNLAGATDGLALTDFVDGGNLGYRFMVNGRPFNGSGVGYNPLALSHDLLNGQPSPRLSAVETLLGNVGNYGMEVALAPNAVQFVADQVNHLQPNQAIDPFSGVVPPGGYVSLNAGRTNPLYPTFAGPGDSDESYDAPDTQNMALASQALQPRLRGRVVNAAGVSLDPDAYYPNGAAPAYLDLEGVTIPSFHRPALANFWFHRLFNSGWLSGLSPADRVRAILSPYDYTNNGQPRAGLDENQAKQIALIKRKFMLRPLREDHPEFDGSNPLSRYGTAAIEAALGGPNLVNNGEITFPFWEAVGPWDVDNDGDGVPDSVWVDVGLPVQQTEDGRWYKPLVAMLVEDLDGRLNLNVHGSNDDVVSNGRQNTPSNQQAVFDFNLLDASDGTPGGLPRNLAQDYSPTNQRPLQSSNQLPGGSGWGVAEVSLRSILSPTLPLDDQLNPANFNFQGNPQYDDYARLLGGRPAPTPGRNVDEAVNGSVIFGRYGSSLIDSLTTTDRNGNPLAIDLTAPGRTYIANATNPIASTRDPRTPLEFLGYPEYLGQLEEASGFASTPDLGGRYAVGLSAAGAKINEARSDRLLSEPLRLNRIVPVMHDSPYELDVSSEARRLAPVSADAVRLSYDPNADSFVQYDTANPNDPGNVVAPLVDDAPFSPAELERILRAFDSDAAKLPDRLWEIVDGFDPDKLAAHELINGAIRAGAPLPIDSPATPDSLQEVIAAGKAAVNRRVVTTDSFDLPVPNENWADRLALGADGIPGVPVDDLDVGLLADDDDDGLTNEGDEAVVGFNPAGTHAFSNGATPLYNDLYRAGCDDYVVVMRANPPASPRMTDFLRYRITLELLRKGTIDATALFSTTPATRAATLVVLDRHINEILTGANRPTDHVSSREPTALDPAAMSAAPALFSYGGLLAPELLAGLRMNLNRPFGDGRDNNGNGVVDEPEEAGEPYLFDPNSLEVVQWLDLNKDGLHDQDLDGDGVLYIDNDGDGILDFDLGDLIDADDRTATTGVNGPRGPEPIVDHLWIDDNNDGVRDANEFRPFDYTRGVDANGRGGYVDIDTDGAFTRGNDRGIRDDARMARQLYARHLYCLMLALTDENYLAPYDSNDPQVVHYINPLSGTWRSGADLVPNDGASIAFWLAGTLFGGDHTQVQALPADETRRQEALTEARRLALQKLTRRKIAQWAINVVDFRDPDAIQTPFEYDENPWDGWNVVDTQGTPDGSDDVVYPLDGELATDENYTQLRLIDGTGITAPGVLVNQTDRGSFSTDPADIDSTRVNLLDRTRGVVWGAERPEAILTEGLAWHDRRLEDLDAGGGEVGATLDDDLDQLRKPKGYVYLEAYNPWTDREQQPAEFYSHVDREGNLVPYDGIRFDRLSNRPVDPSGDPLDERAAYKQTRSPVWRLACVEEHPVLRNASISPKLPEALGVALSLGPVADIKQASDDPPNRLNATSGVQGANDYLGVYLGGGPWMNSVPTLPNSTEEPSTEYGNIDSASGNAPVLSRAYSDIWLEQAVETFLGLATSEGNIQTGVSDADNLSVAVGVLEQPTRLADPSFPTFDRFAQPGGGARSEFVVSSREDGRDSGRTEPVVIDGSEKTLAIRVVDRTILLKPTRFIERVFYMTSPNANIRKLSATGPRSADNVSGIIYGNEEPLPDLNEPGFRIPDLSYDLPLATGTVNTTELRRPDIGVSPADNDVEVIQPNDKAITVSVSKFASIDLLAANREDRVDPIQLAPLLPGRRAVIGTTGPIYERKELADIVIPPRADPDHGSFTGDDARLLYRRYATLVTQLAGSSTTGASNEFLELDPDLPVPNAQLRRFEMIPSERAEVHQFAVRMNGYTDSQTAQYSDGSPFNVTVGPEINAFALQPFAPVIAIPIDHFSISEPLDEYFARQLELDPNLDRLFEHNPTGQRESDRPAEGFFKNGNGTAPFDEPFDLLPELVENQTTPNYRAMHLERLANPLMPWNPPPMLVTGNPNEQHDPALPVNPYLPVDAQALDVTAFNSYSELEADQVGKPPASTEYVHVPTIASGGGSAQDYGPEQRHRRKRPLPGVGGEPETVIGFSSNERDRQRGPFALLWSFQPSRLIWHQSQGATISEILYETVYGSTRSGYAVNGNDSVKADGGVIDPNADLDPVADAGVVRVGDYDLEYDENQFNNGYEESVIDFPWRMTLGFPSWLSGEFYTASGLRWFADTGVDVAVEGIDLDLDGEPGDVLGVAEVNDAPVTIDAFGRPTDPISLQESSTTPAFAWPNRPFASSGELLQVPSWGGSRMLSYYSTFNWLHTQMPGFLHETQVNPYNGEAGVDHDGKDYTLEDLTAGGPTFNGDYADERPEDVDGVLNAEATNDLRFRETLGHFGHLLNFFQTARFPAYAERAEAGVEAPRGAPHFYRVLDYVHVPSRFVATDTLLNPDVFGEPGMQADDPRANLAAPFNRIDRYREPGRVNLNTIVGRRDANEAARLNPSDGSADPPSLPRLGDYWSETYDGLMHRVKDASLLDYAAGQPRDALVAMGHLGPAWRDVALSRRGYVQSTFDPTVDPGDANFGLASSSQNQVDYSPRRMHPAFPTFYANPFRAPGEGANVPLAHMVQTGVDATMLRAHPLSPGADGAWGRRGVDDFTVKKDGLAGNLANVDGIRDDASEAGVLTLELGGGAVADLPNQSVTDRLRADVVLARLHNVGQDVGSLSASQLRARGSIPDTFMESAFRPSLLDFYNPRELAPRSSLDPEDSNYYPPRPTPPPPLFRPENAISNAEISKRATPVALFSGAALEPSLDTERNPTMRYQPIQRMASLATTRSNVYAAWITIGFFEVKQAQEAIPALTDGAVGGNTGRYFLANGDFKSAALRDEFFRVYPDGWTLGEELDFDTGQNRRHRGFYVIDRSRPVAFRPGEDANVAETILLRRRIE